MTPPASAPPGTRSSGGRGGPASSAQNRQAGHRRALRPSPGPRTPRRVSGPLRGRTQAAPAPSRPAAPRRILRPATERLGARALRFVKSLPDGALLDRIIRGRVWIPLLGVMLAGIVAMQVEVLKLGASMGRSIERGSALQSRNELLRASVASLADDQRIERLAAGMGMVMPAPAAVSFLSPHRADARRAAAKVHAPDSSTFLAALAALNAASEPTQAAPTVVSPSAAQATIPSTTATATAPPSSATATAVSSTSALPATTTPTATTPAATTPSATTPVAAATPTQTTAPTGGATAASGG